MELYYLIPGLCAYLVHLFIYKRDQYISVITLLLGIVLLIIYLQKTKSVSYVSKEASILLITFIATLPNLVFYSVFRFATKFIESDEINDNFISRTDLKSVLEDLNTHLGKSEESLYSTHSLADIKNILVKLISQIENGEKLDVRELSVLFLPTGSLQEISIDSDWAEEFLEISSRFDESIGKK